MVLSAKAIAIDLSPKLPSAIRRPALKNDGNRMAGVRLRDCQLNTISLAAIEPLTEDRMQNAQSGSHARRE